MMVGDGRGERILMDGRLVVKIERDAARVMISIILGESLLLVFFI